jgi:hypothetical protein
MDEVQTIGLFFHIDGTSAPVVESDILIYELHWTI